MRNEHCPACGAIVLGGQKGCQTLYDDFVFQAYIEPRLAVLHSLAFDTYCMQHVETYCVSAKSYAAHLTRLCCAVEYDGDPHIYVAIPRWLNHKVEIVKPDLLSKRGALTIADIHAADDLDTEVDRLHQWAKDVWQVYESQHDIAREWIKTALANR